MAQDKKYKRFEFVMDMIIDKKIIEWLEKQPNKANYIRRLILSDINKNGK